MESQEVKEGYKLTEVGVIPEDWEVNDITQVVKVIDGDRGVNYPKSKDLRPSGYCLFLNTKNVTKTGFNFEEQLFISKERDELLNQGKLLKGDIVLTTRGTVGNIAFFDDSVDLEHLRINSGMVILRNENDQNLKTLYLYKVLQSFITQKQISLIAFGSAQPQLTVKGINKIKIPLPPLPEQEKIAQVLSDVDSAIAHLDKLINKKRNLKQGTMQQLLTGKKRLPGFSGEWEVKKLNQVSDVRDGTHESPKYQANGVKFITSKNIINGKLDCSDITYISLEDAQKINKRSKVDKGDILMSMIGTIGNSILIDFEPDFCIKNVALIKPISVSENYLIHFLNSCVFLKSISEDLAGGIQQFISLNKLRNTQILLPQPTEQKAIAQILTDMDAEIEALEKKRDKYKAIKQGMMQELLTGKTRLK
jgi:type I restriction enzyme S subunit